MQHKSFHPFPRLPKELRDMIWTLATRPKEPSAHWFSVFDTSNDAEWSVLSEYALSHGRFPRCVLAAPQRRTSGDKKQELSWAKDNRSAYMTDSGQWMACKESRAAVERRFKVIECNRKREINSRETEISYDHRSRLPDFPATACFFSNDQLQRCLVYPKSDLCILQPFDGTTLRWNDFEIRNPVGYLEHFDVGHIAIEFDPEWLRFGGENYMCHPCTASWCEPGKLGCTIRSATEETHWARRVWYVDYRIRRHSQQHEGPLLGRKTSRQTFHGQNCTFTEVREGDSDWEHPEFNTIFNFLDELWEKVEEYTEDHPYDACYNDRNRLGVLAYEEDSC